MASDMLAMVNQARRSAGARPLRYSNELQDAALRHSRDIARTGNQGHVGKHSSMQHLLVEGRNLLLAAIVTVRAQHTECSFVSSCTQSCCVALPELRQPNFGSAQSRRLIMYSSVHVKQHTSERMSNTLTPPAAFACCWHAISACAGSDGSSIADRIWPMADRMQGCRRGMIAENVAPGSPNSPARHYFDMWMKSAGHRRNILNPAYTHMGVAVASGRATFATQVLHQCK